MSTIALKDISLKISSGGTPSRRHPEYFSYESGHLWVKSKELLDGAIISTEEKITDDALDNSSAKFFPEHSVLLAMYGANVGQLGWLKNPATVNQAICALVIDPKKADWRYVFYSLLQSRGDLIVQARGAAQQNLNQDLIKNFEVPFLPVSHQRIVSDTLGTYDDLIENNARRIQILEQTAQAIYTEWFVNFHFPDHEKVKMIGSGTDFGKIPQGWTVKKLGEIIDISRGRNITKKTVEEGNVPVVAGGLEPAYYHSTANTEAPVVTVSASGANAGFVNLYMENVWASDCSYIDKGVTPFVLYYFLLLKSRQIEVTRLQRGSAQPHVYPKDLSELLVVDVPDNLLKNFEGIVGTVFSFVGNLKKQNKALRDSRDLLLPKLVTGEIETKKS